MLRLLMLTSAVLLGLAPASAAAQSSATDAFVRAWAMAWGAESPVPLLRLAQPQRHLADLVAMERWDELAEATARVSLIGEDKDLRGRRLLRLRRVQHDLFRRGTYATADVEERLVVVAGERGLRVVRYEGARSFDGQSAAPKTWGAKREAERALMLALEALAGGAPERCLTFLGQLFGKDDATSPVAMAEPFAERRIAEANAHFTRAACRQMLVSRTGAVGAARERDDKRIDLDLAQAVVLEPEHALARLLRARRRVAQLPLLAGEQLDASLKAALGDLDTVLERAPDLEDAAELARLLEVVRVLRTKAQPDSDAIRKRMAQELLRAPGRLPADVLARLGTAEEIFRAGPEALALAAELALVDGSVQETSRLLGLLGIRCERCPSYLYLRARHAERIGNDGDALGYYAALVEEHPTHRDGVWRYATLGLRGGRETSGLVKVRLAAAASHLRPGAAGAVRLILALSEPGRRDPDLLSLLSGRFSETPLPPAIRLALVASLRER